MRVFRAAVISADPELRAIVRDSESVSFAHETALAATDVGMEELEALTAIEFDVIMVDMGDEPELGLRLAEHLVGSVAGRPVLVAGPPPSRELLMDAMRAGVEEYLEKPLSAEAFRDALERLGRRFVPAAEAHEPQRPGCIYAFMGVKGGVGTTTIATNVAVALRSHTDRKVLLIDLDFGLGDAALHLGRKPDFDVVDAIENLGRMDAGLLASLVDPYEPNLHLLASPSSLDRIEAVDPGQVQELLRILRDHYRYIIADVPDPFFVYTGEILTEADGVFLVATPEVPALRNIEHVLPLLERQGVGRSGVELILNRYEAERAVPVTEVERIVGVDVRDTVANDYAVTTRSINEGRPVIEADRTPVARDLTRLAASLVGARDPDRTEAATAAPRGLLRSLRRRVREPDTAK